MVKRAVVFSDSVQVREFGDFHEQHPRAFFKIRHPSPPPHLIPCIPSPSLPPSSPSLTRPTQCRDDDCTHHSIHIGSDSGESSETSGIESWEEEIIAEVERRLTVTEDYGEESLEETDTCMEEIQFHDDDDDNDDLEDETFGSIYKDTCCELKDENKEPSSHKLESFKITWTFKRKKKKKLRLKTPQRSRKLLLLGDMHCGKSNLITTYCQDRFSEQYFPTILHCCFSDAKVMGRKFGLILADTSGREDYKPLRKCSSLKTDVAILCYSAGSRSSLERIRMYWLKELEEYAPNCPFIIAETKRDLREGCEDRKLFLESAGETESAEYKSVCREMEGMVPKGLGRQMARELGAQGFYSTSARYRVGTRALFEGATIVAVKKTRRKRQF